MRWNSTILLLTIGFWSPFATRSLAWAGNFDVATLQAEITETIERVRPSAVSITGRRRSFSGVIVSTEGHVLSVAHAVEPGARYRVNLPDGRQFHGIGKGANPWADAALIKIVDPPADLPFVPMGDSSSLVTHQPCLGLSYPGGQKGRGKTVVRFGHVVRNGRHGMLQSSVLMEPGDSIDRAILFHVDASLVGVQ
jgi:serine protease Do